ncbi:MAG: site-specific integrase [Gammaproteobacteria bacterium]|nr:MAG: site-specific integrase [Gammaproteobacteria bacterium]
MSITVTELAEEYCFHNIFNNKTAKDYLSAAAVFEKETKIKSINDTDRNSLTNWKRETLKRKSRHTFNSYLRQLRTLFKYAVEEEYIEKNPFDKVKMAPAGRRLPKTVAPSLISNAVKYLDTNTIQPGWFWQIVIRFFATTGVRRRQLIELQWKDIFNDTNEVLLAMRGSKTYREWLIPINNQVKDDLKYLFDRSSSLATQYSNSQVFNVCLHYHKYRGKNMTDEQLGGFFRRLSERLGEKISPHRIRHTLGTELGKMDGINIFVLQDLLGHTDIRTTRLYVNTDTSDMRNLLKKVDLLK